jgi:hypothetical protein
MSSILDPTPETDITAATHHLHDPLLRMVKYSWEEETSNAVHLLMLVFGKIAPGHRPVDRQWSLKTAAVCGNGIVDVSEMAPENATITAEDGLQEVVTETEIEKDTARRATTAEVGVRAHAEIDHLITEDHLARK